MEKFLVYFDGDANRTLKGEVSKREAHAWGSCTSRLEGGWETLRWDFVELDGVWMATSCRWRRRMRWPSSSQMWYEIRPAEAFEFCLRNSFYEWEGSWVRDWESWRTRIQLRINDSEEMRTLSLRLWVTGRGGSRNMWVWGFESIVTRFRKGRTHPAGYVP